MLSTNSSTLPPTLLQVLHACCVSQCDTNSTLPQTEQHQQILHRNCLYKGLCASAGQHAAAVPAAATAAAAAGRCERYQNCLRTRQQPMQLLADTTHTPATCSSTTLLLNTPALCCCFNPLGICITCSCMPHDNCHAGWRSNRCCCSRNPCASLLQLQAH